MKSEVEGDVSHRLVGMDKTVIFLVYSYFRPYNIENAYRWSDTLRIPLPRYE